MFDFTGLGVEDKSYEYAIFKNALQNLDLVAQHASHNSDESRLLKPCKSASEITNAFPKTAWCSTDCGWHDMNKLAFIHLHTPIVVQNQIAALREQSLCFTNLNRFRGVMNQTRMMRGAGHYFACERLRVTTRVVIM